MKKLLYTMLLLTFQSILGMERDQMTPINTWQDVKPFVGAIVVFTSKKTYFNAEFFKESTAYEIDKDNSCLKVGYIPYRTEPDRWGPQQSFAPNLGYEMHRLVKTECFMHACCALTNDNLEEADLKMRSVNAQEIVKITEAVKKEDAELELCSPILQEEFNYKLARYIL